MTDRTTQRTSQRRNTNPTVLSNWNSTGLSNPLSSCYHCTVPDYLSLLKWKKIPPSSHSMQGMKQIQTANSKVAFAINLKCGLRNTKKPNTDTRCSFPRKEQIHRTLSERGFFMDYVHWLNENYYLWEGTYLWFKA